jgi:hypothetical protein
VIRSNRSTTSLVPFVQFASRAGLGVLLAVGLLVVAAGPALADPAEPSNYEASVTGLDPRPEGVELDVAGGDAFLRINVAPGHEVLIPGYGGEPYVRIDADGSVWVSEDSPAYYQNDDRYSQVRIPRDADGRGDPRWMLVGDDGRYAWHDHRTHWMGFNRPPNVVGDARQFVFAWKIPIQVDGREISVAGQLEWVPSRSAVIPILVGIVALLPLLMWRRRRVEIAAVLVTVAAAGAVALVFAQNAGTPAAARGFPAQALLLPVISLLAGALAFVFRRRADATAWALLTGSLVLIAWAISTIEVLWLPVLISSAPTGLERTAVALILWAGVGVVAIWAVDFVKRLRRAPAP